MKQSFFSKFKVGSVPFYLMLVLAVFGVYAVLDGALDIVMPAVVAHEDDEVMEIPEEGRWVLACEDVVTGCTEGGVFYHTKDGPTAGVYFLAHYRDTGNVYARKVSFD